MKTRFSWIVLIVIAAGFAWGLGVLFLWRFESGDIYPEYSSLRADPLGTMAFYESLASLPGISVERDFRPDDRLPEGQHTTYLHLAAHSYDWVWQPADLFKEMENFAVGGGRLVITFLPEPTRPLGYSAWDYTTNRTFPVFGSNTNRMSRVPPSQRLRRSGEDEFEGLAPMEARWGVAMTHVALSEGYDTAYQPETARLRAELDLPRSLDWHSGLVFTNVSKAWRVIYTRGTNPVVIERSFGAGRVVMATDSYFLSNEAMVRDRHADLLAWTAGPSHRVIFDEAHFGIVDTSGVAVLMRKYRLYGVAAGLVLLAVLFIWKNATSLVPPPREELPPDYVAGRDAAAGFVNLLRRNIPSRDILSTCFNEWTRSLAHGGHYTLSGVDRAQTLMEGENARTGPASDPVRTYREICAALKSRGPQSATAKADTKSGGEPLTQPPATLSPSGEVRGRPD